MVPVAHLSQPSINEWEKLLVGRIENGKGNRMTPIKDHIERNILPEDPQKQDGLGIAQPSTQ